MPSLGNPLEFLLPPGRKLRFLQILRHQLQKLLSLGSNQKIVPFLFHIKGMKQLFDNVRTGGDRPKPTLFHCSQKGCFRIPCRRFRLSFGPLLSLDEKALPLFQIRECLIAQLILPIFLLDTTVVDCSPSGLPDRLSFCDETLFADRRLNTYLLILCRRVENRQKSPYNQIINLPFLRSHMGQVHKLLRRNNRMMVAHLAVIHKPFLRFERLSMKGFCKVPKRPCLARFHTLSQSRNNI